MEPTFFSSLIQDHVANLDGFFNEPTGAVLEGTRDDESPPFLFSEVTGYAIRDLLHVHDLTGDERYLTWARKAATWLTTAAWHDQGWILTRFYLNEDNDPSNRLYSFSGGNVFLFDNAICLMGLLDLYRRTKCEMLRDRMDTLAGNLLKQLRDDGSLPPILNVLGGNDPIPEPSKWSQRSGAFHAKIAEAFVELWSVTADQECKKKYQDAALKICRFALRQQQDDDGRFVTDRGGRTQLHPHCYAAEGILHVGYLLQEDKLLDAARRATMWALKQRTGQLIPQEFEQTGPVGPFPRTDAVAQVLRLGARLYRMGELPEQEFESLEMLASGVLSTKDPDENYFRYGMYEDGKESFTRSYWTNMFAFHGLLEYAAAWVARNTVALVLAGGTGTRCWPISCENRPKPLSRDFLAHRSLLEETVARFVGGRVWERGPGWILPENLFVVSGAKGLLETRDQVRGLGVPPENVVEEKHAMGTLHASRLAMAHIKKKGKKLIVVSMADNLILPLPMFRDAFWRAAVAAWRSEKLIVGLGIPREWPKDPPDDRFGHEIYDRTNVIVNGVYHVDEFVEKPNVLPHLSENQSFAWNSGSVVSTFAYLSEQLDAKADAACEQNLTTNLLQKQDVQKAVSLYKPAVRFADLGSPGEDLRSFFLGTEYDHGNGNVVLGPEGVEVILLRSRRNIIISDRTTEVIGIDDHLIINNSFTNAAVVLPLNEARALPTLYRMFADVNGFDLFVTGGSNDVPRQNLDLGSESCETHSGHGLAATVRCRAIRLERTLDRLRVVGNSHIRLSNEEVEIIEQRKDDPELVRHLLDVTIIGEILSNPIGLPEDARGLLRLACLTHDIGGYLAEDKLATEQSVARKAEALTGLAWTDVDVQVLRALILQHPECNLTHDERHLLSNFNDSIQSALEVLKIKHFQAFPYLDELIYLLCNQEEPAAFRRPFSSRFSLPAEEDLVKVFSCLKAADAWVYTHCLWKKKLRRKTKEHIAGFMAFLCRTLRDAEAPPTVLVDYISREMLNRESALYEYTCGKLRVQNQPDGNLERVPLFGSDNVYLAFMSGARGMDDTSVSDTITETVSNRSDKEVELLIWLPHHLHVMACSGLLGIEPGKVKNLAYVIMGRCREERRQVWDGKNDARDSLLDALKWRQP